MSGAQHGKTQYVSSVVMYEQCGVYRELFKKWHGNSKEKALEMLRSPCIFWIKVTVWQNMAYCILPTGK